MIEEMMRNTSVQAIENTILALRNRKETCSRLGEIKIPVLIMVGQDDKVTPPEKAHFMHKQIKDSEFQMIPSAGHLSNLENADLFNQHLLKFINAF
jgi:3-oxoadipate enol-lactonase